MSVIKKTTFIPASLFIQMVDVMPLVSLDLVIVRDQALLLGKRNNRPAQHFWFVPGGRILKDETIQTALARIAQKELGLNLASLSTTFQPSFYGVYEHFYQDAFAGEMDVSTHYVVIAFKVEVGKDFDISVHDEQHSALEWWDIATALDSEQVHQYTKNYFLQKELK